MIPVLSVGPLVGLVVELDSELRSYICPIAQDEIHRFTVNVSECTDPALARHFVIHDRWEMDLSKDEVILADGLDQSVVALVLGPREEKWLSFVQVAFGTGTALSILEKANECGESNEDN